MKTEVIRKNGVDIAVVNSEEYVITDEIGRASCRERV